MPLIGGTSKEPTLYKPEAGKYMYGTFKVDFIPGPFGAAIALDIHRGDMKYFKETDSKYRELHPAGFFESWGNFIAQESQSLGIVGRVITDIFTLGTYETIHQIPIGTATLAYDAYKTVTGQATAADYYNFGKGLVQIAAGFIPGVGPAVAIGTQAVSSLVETSLSNAGVGTNILGNRSWSEFGFGLAGLVVPSWKSGEAVFNRIDLVENVKSLGQQASMEYFKRTFSDLDRWESRTYHSDFFGKETLEIGDRLKSFEEYSKNKYYRDGEDYAVDRLDHEVYGKVMDNLNQIYELGEAANFLNVKFKQNAMIKASKDFSSSMDSPFSLSTSIDRLTDIRDMANNFNIPTLSDKLNAFLTEDNLRLFTSLEDLLSYLMTNTGRRITKIGNVSEFRLRMALKRIFAERKLKGSSLMPKITRWKAGIDKFNRALAKPIKFIDKASKIAENMGAEIFGDLEEKAYEELKETSKVDKMEKKYNKVRTSKTPAYKRVAKQLVEIEKEIIESGGTLVNSHVIAGYRVLQQSLVGFDENLVQIIFNPHTTGAKSLTAKNHGGKKPVYVRATDQQLLSLRERGMRYYLDTWAISRGGKIPESMKMIDEVLGNVGAFIPIGTLNKLLIMATRIKRAVGKYYHPTVNDFMKEWSDEMKQKAKVGLRSTVATSAGGGRIGRAAGSLSTGSAPRLRRTEAQRAYGVSRRYKTKVNKITNLVK